ncbi:MAG: type II toxin-antitoxin system prevent-host-death family antitoxin [Thermoleophilia bacterium]|nr:type II toxin-antitoxin system prevent-host-death family antitoxin [Thermoleophilia bacterium]
MKQTTVSIRELKSHLSRYLRLAKAGQTVEVTERGKPIGRIVPVGVPVHERLEAMARLGFLVQSEGKLEPRAPVA